MAGREARPFHIRRHRRRWLCRTLITAGATVRRSPRGRPIANRLRWRSVRVRRRTATPQSRSAGLKEAATARAVSRFAGRVKKLLDMLLNYESPFVVWLAHVPMVVLTKGQHIQVRRLCSHIPSKSPTSAIEKVCCGRGRGGTYALPHSAELLKPPPSVLGYRYLYYTNKCRRW